MSSMNLINVFIGLMTESEMKIYEKMDQKAKVLKFWMPVVWASNLINRARHEGRIQSDHMVQTIVTELSDFRRKLGRIMVFDNVSVPLVYTQVRTLKDFHMAKNLSTFTK